MSDARIGRADGIAVQLRGSGGAGAEAPSARKIREVVNAALASLEAGATKATSRAEREAALAMIERHDPGSGRRLTLAADKGYDTRAFVEACREMCVTPHVSTKIRHSANEGRTTRHAASAVSQRKRKLIEEAFGWAKTIAGLAEVKVRGLARVRHCFTLATTVYNLIRMPKVLGWQAA